MTENGGKVPAALSHGQLGISRLKLGGTVALLSWFCLTSNHLACEHKGSLAGGTDTHSLWAP